MLFTSFGTYGYWLNKERGEFIPLRFFDRTTCHGSGCDICHGQRYLRKDGTMSGGTMYVFVDMNSIDTRYVICPKCANKNLFSLRGKSYTIDNRYSVPHFAKRLSDISNPKGR